MTWNNNGIDQTNLFLIKMVANMAEWEYANGHDAMADKFRRVLSVLVAYEQDGNTNLEDPQEMADMICQAYQDHIIEHYDRPKKALEGEITVVRELTKALDNHLRNDPS